MIYKILKQTNSDVYILVFTNMHDDSPKQHYFVTPLLLVFGTINEPFTDDLRFLLLAIAVSVS